MPNNALFDAALELRDVGDGAETSTASETGIAFDVLHMGNPVVMVHVTAIDDTTDDETYVLDVEVSDLVAGTYTSIAEVTLDNGMTVPASFPIPIHSQLAALLDADAAFIRITATLGGTTPSITYGAYVAPAMSGNAGMAQDRA